MAVNMEGASPPIFEQIFRNARFAQGGNALFEGKVAGSPRPQVLSYFCQLFTILLLFLFCFASGCVDPQGAPDERKRQAPNVV